MTEFEINKAVTEKLGYIYTKSFDPCNNVEQAWEIMMKCGITIVFEHGEYHFTTPDGEYLFAPYDSEVENNHKKPLVAVMLCFLEL